MLGTDSPNGNKAPIGADHPLLHALTGLIYGGEYCQRTLIEAHEQFELLQQEIYVVMQHLGGPFLPGVNNDLARDSLDRAALRMTCLARLFKAARDEATRIAEGSTCASPVPSRSDGKSVH
jgi:hypothetical protein